MEENAVRKTLVSLSFALSAVAVMASSAVLLSACSKEEVSEWNVSAEGGNVTVSMTDNGNYGFVLTAKGSGKMRDYASAKDAPWYGKSGRITDIVVSDGVTAIGSNAFANCAAKSVVLPESVSEVGEKSFPAKTKIFSRQTQSASISVADGLKVYLYSEDKPASEGSYWRYIGENATVWEATSVLFIGNSFTYYSDIPKLFGEIATAAGELVTVDSVTQGAWTLTKFADKSDEYGKIVDEKLSNNEYDVVVLQEQSTRPLTNYNAFLTAARDLQTKIRQTQTDCRIYLYSTWGYTEGAASRKETIPEMEAELRKAYDDAAKELNVQVSHVGTAFSKVYTENPELNLYYSDDKHPSYTGAFLSASVHVATILGCDPRLSDFVGDLGEETAALLKSAAYETVFGK